MAGHPPAQFHRHHTIGSGDFAPGAVIAIGATLRALIPVWSSTKVRIRFLATVAGELRALIPLPGVEAGKLADWADEDLDALAAEASPGPTQVVTVADTEAIIELGTATSDFELAGEAYVLLEFENTAVGAGSIIQVTVSQV